MKIIFISCGKTKAKGPCKARDLYQGALFKKSLAYAEQLGDAVYILSAKYGIMHPDVIIETYEKTLNKMSKRERQKWAHNIRETMQELGLFRDPEFIYLCGERYREGLPKGITPMEGLSFGRQLQWLNEKLGGI